MIETIYGIIGFIVGTIVGYLIRGITAKMEKKDESTLIMLVVTAVWAISVIVDMVIIDYETPMLLHGIMGGIVGYFFKFRIEGNTK